MQKYRVQIVIGSIIVTLMMMNLFLLAIIEGIPGSFFTAFPRGFWLGIFIGQLNLISIWAAISKGSLIVRLPWALLLIVLMWLSYAAGQFTLVLLDVPRMFGRREIVSVAYMLALGCIVMQIPLWIASRLGGWQLTRTDSSRDSQFGIRQLFLGTTLLAITMAIVRHFSEQLPSPLVLLKDHITVVFLIAAAVCNLLLVMPCIWFALRRPATIALCLIGFAVAAAVSLLEFAGIVSVIGGPGDKEVKWGLVFIGVNCGQMAVVYTCLLILKYCAGFQLLNRRQSSQSEHASATTDATKSTLAN